MSSLLPSGDGRHVRGSAEDRATQRHRRRRDGRRVFGSTKAPPFWHGVEGFRETEIQHLHRAVWPHLHVCGFQVAMDDTLLVRGFERLGDLARDRQRFVERYRSARDSLREIFPLDEFHHEGVAFDPVDGCDVGMVERRQHLRFAREPRQPIRIEREGLRQDLDRDVTIELGIPCAIDDAHATFADLGDDLVGSD
jgi:hypothetical protein